MSVCTLRNPKQLQSTHAQGNTHLRDSCAMLRHMVLELYRFFGVSHALVDSGDILHRQ